MGLELLIGAGVLFAIAGFLRPGLITIGRIRLTGFLRVWENRLVHSKQGYADIKDAKIEQQTKRQDEIVDHIATLRAQKNQLTRKSSALEEEERRLGHTKEQILGQASNLTEDTPEYQESGRDLGIVTKRLEVIDREQEILVSELGSLQRELENTMPFLDELQDEIAKIRMEKELGLIKHDVAELQEERARRRGVLQGIGQTSVDKLETEADTYLDKKIERGKTLAEHAGANATDVTAKYAREVRGKTDAERLAAALKERRAKQEIPTTTTETHGRDTLSK